MPSLTEPISPRQIGFVTPPPSPQNRYSTSSTASATTTTTTTTTNQQVCCCDVFKINTRCLFIEFCSDEYDSLSIFFKWILCKRSVVCSCCCCCCCCDIELLNCCVFVCRRNLSILSFLYTATNRLCCS
jgi:hypothetical protein